MVDHSQQLQWLLLIFLGSVLCFRGLRSNTGNQLTISPPVYFSCLMTSKLDPWPQKEQSRSYELHFQASRGIRCFWFNVIISLLLAWIKRIREAEFWVLAMQAWPWKPSGLCSLLCLVLSFLFCSLAVMPWAPFLRHGFALWSSCLRCNQRGLPPSLLEGVGVQFCIQWWPSWPTHSVRLCILTLSLLTQGAPKNSSSAKLSPRKLSVLVSFSVT